MVCCVQLLGLSLVRPVPLDDSLALRPCGFVGAFPLEFMSILHN